MQPIIESRLSDEDARKIAAALAMRGIADLKPGFVQVIVHAYFDHLRQAAQSAQQKQARKLVRIRAAKLSARRSAKKKPAARKAARARA